MLRALRDHYLRIDARSLGLFRIAFALVLIGDLRCRWAWLRAFYSNEGVLPNHNHLFNLIQKGTSEVWSVYHAFSTPGENHFAFALTLLVYVAFLVGWKTRVFHALSLACLVSLTGRNILLEGAGNYAAIAILAFTLFLPCGSRLSIDSLRASLKAREEKTAADLNDRGSASDPAVEAERLPGWTPTSLAALAVLAQIAIIYASLAIQHSGAPWKDGSALHYALHVERWATGLGVAVRSAPPGALRALTYLVYVAEWAIPILIFLPVARRAARVSSAVLMLIHGFVFGALLSFGLFGWALAAAAPLVITRESWEAMERSWKRGRARTVIYDVDCGICLLLSRILKRVDYRRHLTFQGNDITDALLMRKSGGKSAYREPFPESVKPDTMLTTVVVIDLDGHIYTRGRAVVETLKALPFGWVLAWPLRIPGISHALDKIYDAVAARRHNISAMLGLGSCGITPPGAASPEGAGGAAIEVPSSTRIRRGIVGGARELAVAAMFAAMLAQTAKVNAVPASLAIPQGKVLAAIAAWPRMLAKWDVLAPAPPMEDGALVVDAQTKANVNMDPMTGRAPAWSPDDRRGGSMGQLWNDYIDRVRDKEWLAFQKAFRDYLAKGSPSWTPQPPDPITGFDAYWVTTPSPPPGGPRPQAEQGREKLFTHSRGGRLQMDKLPPIVRPDARRPQ